MTEPTIICPKCKTEIKLTESLAAPLIEAKQREFEQRLDEKLRQARAKITAEESKKAKLAIAIDIEQKNKDIIELQEVLRQRDTKLAEAQKAHGEIQLCLRKDMLLLNRP